MVVDQDHLIRVPKLLKAHFLEFFRYKRDKYIMDHDTVHIYSHNISRLYFFAGIMLYDLFNYCLSHCILPL